MTEVHTKTIPGCHDWLADHITVQLLMASDSLYVSLHIRNLNLYGAALHIRTRLKCTHSIFDRKTVRHQFLNVAQHPSLHETYCLGPCVGIPVLEFEVDLPRRQPHKREPKLVLPDADDENGAAELDSMDCSADRCLCTSALKGDVRLYAAHRLDHPRGKCLRCLVRRDAQWANMSGRKG